MDAHSKRRRGSDDETSEDSRKKAKSAPASATTVAEIAQGCLEESIEEHTGSKATLASKKKRQREEEEEKETKEKNRRKRKRAKLQQIAMGESKTKVMGEEETSPIGRVKQTSNKAKYQIEKQLQDNKREEKKRGYAGADSDPEDLDEEYIPVAEDFALDEAVEEQDTGGRSKKRPAAQEPVTERQLVVPRSEKAQTDAKREKKVRRAAMATHFSTCIPLPALIT